MTDHASIRGQPPPIWAKELEEGRATGYMGDHDGLMTGPRRDYTTGRGGDNTVHDQQDVTCWGLHEGVGYINTRGSRRTHDEASARPVTGRTRRVHGGSNDWTTTGYVPMRG